MPPTRDELQLYRNIERIRVALEQIADVMKSMNTLAAFVVEQQGGALDPTEKER